MRSVMSGSLPEQLSHNLESNVPLQPVQCEKMKNALKSNFGAWKDENHPELQDGVDYHVRNLRKSTRSGRTA